MTSGQTGILRGPNDGVHWGTAIASLVVGAAFLALWVWSLPAVMATSASLSCRESASLLPSSRVSITSLKDIANVSSQP
jgi:hypothetical protein